MTVGCVETCAEFMPVGLLTISNVRSSLLSNIDSLALINGHYSRYAGVLMKLIILNQYNLFTNFLCAHIVKQL